MVADGSERDESKVYWDHVFKASFEHDIWFSVEQFVEGQFEMELWVDDVIADRSDRLFQIPFWFLKSHGFGMTLRAQQLPI